MPPETPNTQRLRNGRAKTNLACDACRRRKSRCDGARPTCSHCVEAGVQCIYRATPTTLENDASILTRLAATESHMQLLEQRLAIEAVRPSQGVRRALSAPDPDESDIPAFHHGAGHKVLQYWPRLRVKLTMANVNVLTFLKDLDREDAFLFRRANNLETFQLQVPIASAHQALTSFYDSITDLPIPLASLLTSCELFYKDRILRPLHSISDHPSITQGPLDVRDLAIEELLVYSLAFRETPTAVRAFAFSSNDTSEAWFKMGLERLWELYAEPEERAVPLMLGFAHVLLYVFARPFHALGLSQNIYIVIDGLLKRSGSRSFESHNLLYSRLHYMLQR